ncbi:hypothetical protein A2U01_0103408, partial [Trifolium medium]|nr:hypothetical protein [Trifolium medium]
MKVQIAIVTGAHLLQGSTTPHLKELQILSHFNIPARISK